MRVGGWGIRKKESPRKTGRKECRRGERNFGEIRIHELHERMRLQGTEGDEERISDLRLGFQKRRGWNPIFDGGILDLRSLRDLLQVTWICVDFRGGMA